MTAGTLNITGDSVLNGNVTAGALYITGNAYIGGNVTVGSLSISGPVSLANITTGSLYVTGDSLLEGNITAGALYVMNNSYLNTTYINDLIVNGVDVTPSLGDIAQEQSFSANNNQTSAQDITGFTFSNSVARSFDSLVSVYIDNGGSGLFASYNLKGINRTNFWQLNSDFIGDNTGVTFAITSTGQIQYTSTNVVGFVSNTIKYRALTTSV